MFCLQVACKYCEDKKCEIYQQNIIQTPSVNQLCLLYVGYWLMICAEFTCIRQNTTINTDGTMIKHCNLLFHIGPVLSHSLWAKINKLSGWSVIDKNSRHGRILPGSATVVYLGLGLSQV